MGLASPEFGSPDFWALWLSPWVLGLLGLLVGSFLNVVIHRKPVMMMREWLADTAEMFQEGEVSRVVFDLDQPTELTAAGARLAVDLESLSPLSLVAPRSRCGACGHQIRWYENIPVLSWLALRGRCSACKTPISLRYPAVELLTGALFAATAWKFGPHPATLAWCAAVAMLVAMSFIDLDTKYLPDDLTQPLLWGGLALAAAGASIPLSTSLWGVFAGYVPLWLIVKTFALVMRREGMGMGDLKLLAALGAWLGWQAILPIVLMSSVAGLCVNLPRSLVRRHGRNEQYPFGPFLAAGGLAVMFVGTDPLLQWAGVSLQG